MGRGLEGIDLEREMPGDEEFRGRGIALMRRLVDRIQFESRPEKGTIVHLQKRLDLAETSPLMARAGRADAGRHAGR